MHFDNDSFLFEYILLIILAILPIGYKMLFWLYSIQLKEYRLDRFKEYLRTPQGKKAVFNFWFLIEIPILFLSLSIFINPDLEMIVFPLFFHFLLIENIFVIGKIFRGRILKPKITKRLLLTFFLLILIDVYLTYFILFMVKIKGIYLFILGNLLFLPFLIFFVIFISLPIVNYLKHRIIKKAIVKSKKISSPIKIGITGSYGKSTVKEFLSSILEQDDKTLKTPKNINTELGVSKMILTNLQNNYKYFVAEMGAYRIGEIAMLGNIVNHKYGFLTAIGIQHLGLFGSKENIKKGKSEIANKVLENNGILYVNWDNNDIRNTKFDKNINIVKYGLLEGSEAKSTIIDTTNGKTKFVFQYKKEKIDFFINMIGKHYIQNLSGIIAFCLDIGISKTKLKKYILNLKLPDNTLEIKIKRINKCLVTVINDTYNLSKAGLFAGLELLNSFPKTEIRILVLDDILELGKDSKKIHFEVGKMIAEKKLIDKIYYVGVNYKKNLIQGLLKGGFKKENIINNVDIFKNNSVVLLEGRKSLQYLNNI